MTLPLSVARAFYGARASLREAQLRAIDPLMAGQDVLVIAGTGSGKTEAVVAPVVARHLDSAHASQGVVLLYISPTKALANDMAARLEVPLEPLHLGVGIRHGDRNDLDKRQSPSLLITTPESLDNLLVKRHPRLRSVEAVIVDELHQLAGTQRGLQLCILLERLQRHTNRPVQVAGMSATLADPRAAWTSIRPSGRCEVVEVISDRKRDFVVRREVTPDAEVDLLSKTSSKGKVLAFARSRATSELVAHRLRDRGAFGERVYVHHSSLDKEVRAQVERDLKGQDATICVATSTLELGIDIGDINLVVLLGAPYDWRSFEQRIGRTNRRGTQTNVLALVPPEVDLPVVECAYFLGLIGQVERTFRRAEPRGQLYGALAQQAVSMVRQAGDYLPVRELVELLAGAPGTAADDVESIVDALVEAEYLVRHPVRNQVGADRMVHLAVETGQAWGNLPANGQSLQLYHGTTRLGEVPALPKNVVLMQPGKCFAFRGRLLRVQSVVRGREVRVEPTSGTADGTLQFGGSIAARDPLLVSQIPEVLRWGRADQHLAASVAPWWTDASRHCAEALHKDSVPYWPSDRGVAHATFAGLWLNRVLTALAGGDPATATEVAAFSSEPLRVRELPSFEEVSSTAVEQAPQMTGLTTWQQLLPRELLMRELSSAWSELPYYREAWQRLQRQSLHRVDDRLSALT